MIDTISVTDLKQNASNILKKLKYEGKSIMVLQRSKASAILVDPQYYAVLEKALEDLEDIRAINKRSKELTISFDEVAKKFNDA